MAIVAKAANVLHELHSHNIIHGDVKPANIFLDNTETDVFLIDPGMVQPVGEDFTVIFGTFRYMHPALKGDSGLSLRESGPVTSRPHGRVGAYIDIYALGITVLEMLAGEAEIRLPPSERQLVVLLRSKNPIIGTLAPEILDQLANMIFQMLTIRPEEEGITAHTISSICTTIVRHFQGKNVAGMKTVKLSSIESQEHVPEDLMNVGQGVREAVLRLESIAKSLNESTAMMIRTAEKLEMATTEGSDSPILEELNQVFRNALDRTRASWKIAIIMTIVCFLTIITMIFSAVLLTILTGTASWSMIFGGAGVLTVIGTLIWHPYDRAFRATILAQQLEMIHVQAIAAFRGTTDIEYRIRICREATDRLQILLEQHATNETRGKTTNLFKTKGAS